MLYSGKKIRAWRDKKNEYSNSCVVRKKNSERNKKSRLFHVTIWIYRWRMNTLVTSQYQPRLSSITKIFSRRISQSDWNIQIKLNYLHMDSSYIHILFYFSVCPGITNCNYRKCDSPSDNYCEWCQYEIVDKPYWRAYTRHKDGRKKECRSKMLHVFN